MPFQIRPFVDTDYPAIIAIHNTSFPEYRHTEAEQRFWDTSRGPERKFARWVVEVEGQVVGWADYDQPPWMFHPHKFLFDITIHPEHQGHGLGKALYSHLQEQFDSLEAQIIRTRARADRQVSVDFLLHRQFYEEM